MAWIKYLAGMSFFVLLVVFAIQALFLGLVQIPSGSMSPTLRVGDQVLVNKSLTGIEVFGYELFDGWSPSLGDVVVFSLKDKGASKDSEQLYIKRVVGRPGDVVQVVDDQVLIDGYRIYEKDYIQIIDSERSDRKARANFGPLRLNSDEFFVMGDDRSNSLDSRIYGPINLSSIIGRAELVVTAARDDEDGESRNFRWVR